MKIAMMRRRKKVDMDSVEENDSCNQNLKEVLKESHDW
jgi:hypothetical protein